MLLSDFLTVAFIPPLIISPINSSSDEDNRNDRSMSSSFFSPEDDDFFNRDLPTPSPPRRNVDPQVADPILRAIYEEEKRLELSEGGDDDMNSEEAREMISFQRMKLGNQQPNPQVPSERGRDPRGRFQFSGEGGSPFFLGPQNERINAGYLTSTQFPILLPSASREEVEETTPARPVMARLGGPIGGAVNKLRTGVVNTFGGFGRKIWGSSQTTTTTSTAPPPSNMAYPGEPNRINFGDDNDNTPLHCNGTQTEYQKKCYNLLQPFPCPDGQWLIEDDSTGKGKCVENKCAQDKTTAFFAGKCVKVSSEEDCHRGMRTYIFKNGDVECDCKEQHLFNQRDGNCYPAYRMGPCKAGDVFIARVTASGTLPASCVRSKCSKDGFFCNAPFCPNDRNCVELKSKCEIGIYDIDPKTLTPKCLDFTFKPQRIIGNVPTLACAPGSRRDILGTCRKPTQITFS